MNKEQEKEIKKNIVLKYSKESVTKILTESYSEECGARLVKNYIEWEIGTLAFRNIVSRFLQSASNYLFELEQAAVQIKITIPSLLEQEKNLLKEKYE